MCHLNYLVSIDCIEVERAKWEVDWFDLVVVDVLSESNELTKVSESHML